jgi:hypothetical protein
MQKTETSTIEPSQIDQSSTLLSSKVANDEILKLNGVLESDGLAFAYELSKELADPAATNLANYDGVEFRSLCAKIALRCAGSCDPSTQAHEAAEYYSTALSHFSKMSEYGQLSQNALIDQGIALGQFAALGLENRHELINQAITALQNAVDANPADSYRALFYLNLLKENEIPGPKIPEAAFVRPDLVALLVSNSGPENAFAEGMKYLKDLSEDRCPPDDWTLQLCRIAAHLAKRESDFATELIPLQDRGILDKTRAIHNPISGILSSEERSQLLAVESVNRGAVRPGFDKYIEVHSPKPINAVAVTSFSSKA